ncbi:MAG: phosphoenolpyruvate--protein phosphotransferase [Candidatus Aminicenantaceae bacterium]
MEYVRLRGIGVSPGIAIGEVSLIEEVVFSEEKENIAPGQINQELKRFKSAVSLTKKQLSLLKNQVKETLGKEYSIIIESHILILEDKSLLSSVEKIIKEELSKSERALSLVHKKYKKIFDSISDDYFRQRKADITDVLTRIYKNLHKEDYKESKIEEEKILVAHDLLPSEAAMKLSNKTVLAVATDMGGQTSHTAILARSLNIPAVVGTRDVTQKVKNGDYLVVDGTVGEIIINPPSAIKREFLSKKKRYDEYHTELVKIAKRDSLTLDNIKFVPLANLELPEEVKKSFSLGAEGIGLFRTEFIYFQKESLPSEEDHFSIYSSLAKSAHPSPVYIRTIDIGGEKTLPQLKIEKEPNPALGLRAIRFSLRDKNTFKIQLRAILRASFLKNVKLLIPMITEVEEVKEFKYILNEVKEELNKENVKFDQNIPVGIMIEVPAAAAITDLLVEEVDYLSIGTNDLIQYYLAVDRTNEYVSYLYKPFHPSVLRLIKYIIETAQKANKEIAVCGEMAADPLSAIVLIGFGLRIFSMNPIFIPKVKNVLRAIRFDNVKDIVRDAMKLKTAQEIEEYLIEKILIKYPKAFLMWESLK